MKSVRQAFSLAFGEVPEGAYICLIASEHKECVSCQLSHWQREACFYYKNKSYFWHESTTTSLGVERPGFWEEREGWGVIMTVDISDRPATAFMGFFGDAYDKILDEIPPQNPASNEPKIL